MRSNILQKVFRHVNTKLDYVLNLGLSKPEIIYLQITDKCNFHCQNCDIWKNTDMPELDLIEWERIIKSLKNFRTDLAVMVSGGEPLMYNNFNLFLDLLKKYGVGISLNTNGFLLDEKKIDEFLERGLDRVEISLYSLRPEINNALRNTPFAFEHAYRAIQNLVKRKKEMNLKTDIIVAFLLNNHNVDEMEEYIKHFSDLGVWTTVQSLDYNIQSLDDDKNRSLNDECDVNDELWINDREKVIKAFDRLYTMKKEGYLIYNRVEQFKMMKKYYLRDYSDILKLPCYSGQNNLIINSKGEGFFCFRGPCVGNFVKDDAENVWKSKKAKDIRKQIKSCPKPCRMMNCNYSNSLYRKGVDYMKRHLLNK